MLLAQKQDYKYELRIMLHSQKFVFELYAQIRLLYDEAKFRLSTDLWVSDAGRNVLFY